jgi:4-hydroxysphinganine ceramide fatty acyl 2-hydroxylase
LDENGLLYKCLKSDNYEDFLKKPISNRSSPIIFNKYIDIFTKTNYYIIPITWMPIMIFFLSNNDISFNVLSLLFLIGMFSWTFIEYIIHRFLFHNNYIIKGNKFLNFIHFLLHGIHHKIPFDKYRLVTPPILLLSIGGSIIYIGAYVLTFFVEYIYIRPIISGSIFCYIIYDLTHYYIHVGNPSKDTLVYKLKQHHSTHHYKNNNLNYGVSSKIWDNVFNTTYFLDNNLNH